MRRFWLLLTLLAGLLGARPGYCLPPLQLFVDLTPAGGVLRPPPGTYAGPVVLRRPITLEGDGQVTIDGEGRGTVLSIQSTGVTVRGLHLIHSGESYDAVDAGVLVAADDDLVEDNLIEQTLFGIHLRQANGNTVRHNRITGFDRPVNLRGDGMRMWYSHENNVEQNQIERVRDFMVINSSDNQLKGNTVEHSGVSMEFVFAPDNSVEGNTFSQNDAGIVVLYSNGVHINANQLLHMRSAAGAALAVKDSSEVVVQGNDILHCAVGIEANAPTHPENTLQLLDNRIAYNNVAMYFYGEKGGHQIHGNRFEHNLLQVAVSAPTSARANDWRGNFWDDYAGFDQDGDGHGDLPYELYIYADRLWMDRPMTSFFRGSPVLETIDFIERLAPFSPPALVLRDPSPLIR